VQELLDMDREIKAKRKAFNVDEGKITKEKAGAAQSGKRRKNASDKNGVAPGAAETKEAEGGESGGVVAKDVIMGGGEAEGAVGSEGVASA
jgi:transcription initiation factor TFIID subunit 13